MGANFYKITIILMCTLALSSCSFGKNEKLSESTPPAVIPENVILEETPTPPPERMTKNNVFLEKTNIGNMKESKVKEIITDMALKIDVTPVDAKFDKDTWEVTRGKMGKKLNVEKTLKSAMAAKENQKLKVIVEEVSPPLTSKGLKSKIKTIASFSTKLLDTTKSRVNNIKLASKAINGTKLMPGDEFSFNGVVGQRTVEKGYQEAPIIMNTPEGPKKDKGVGGGICQISTTIYNAIEECGLEITERHLHSKKVGYVAKGDDATVVYGGADLKFRNNREHPIMLRIYVEKGTITVEVVENGNM